MAMPLDGIRVVDWTVYQQGPVASMMLGDLGAEVIKIEALGTGDPARGQLAYAGFDLSLPGGRATNFEFHNRNKKSVAVDLRSERGKEIIYRLIERSDVFIQNFRVGAADRLGLGYEALREHNPLLIYASASGFGPLGPERDRPVYDNTASARAGLHDALYPLDSQAPPHPPIMFADQNGATLLAYGVLAALFARERLGIGQKVDSSLLGGMIWLQGFYVNNYLLKGKAFPRVGHQDPTNPLVNSYRCRDGKWLFLALTQYDRYWADFCEAVGHPDLKHDPRFANADQAAAHHQALIAILDEVLAEQTSDEWIEAFRGYPDFIYQKANSVAEVVDDPQVLANHYITDFCHPVVGNVKMTNVPVSLSETPGGIRLPAPELGEHTDAVLTEICGYTRDDLVALREAGTI